MPNVNQQLIVIFQEMASVLQIVDGDIFRVNAFNKAARTIDELALDLGTFAPPKDSDAPVDIAKISAATGLGKGTAQRIGEFLTTGKIAEHQELLSQVPPGVMAMLGIPGIGPKTAAMLWKEAGIDSVEKLHEKAQGDEMTHLKGFGAKKLENLRKSLALAKQATQRQLIGHVLPLAQWFLEKLRNIPNLPGAGVQQCAYAGSLRRGKETIGDLDLLVAASAEATPAIMQAFVKLEPVAEILAQGATKSAIRTGDGLQVDLRVVEPVSYGAALLYFTGSKEHNVQLRQLAIDHDLRLNEYGLLNKDQKNIASKTEEDIYKALGCCWIPPEIREGRNELALAKENKIPTLLEKKDIHAELHCHTNASDGRWTMRELVQVAIEMGFHTLAITDHSQSQFVANGLKPERLEKQIIAIRELAKEVSKDIQLLAGSEVDILPDGKLDYPDSLLRELDVVVASPHASLTQENDKATKRLLKAMENRYITILGHPTGRLVNRREGLSPDMPLIIEAAAKRGIALEINANTHRLDLRDTHARAALAAGVKLAINTDAHSLPDLDQLIYGVLTARRAGATKADVVNCLSRVDLLKWIRGTKL